MELKEERRTSQKLRVLTLNCWGLPNWFTSLFESSTIKSFTKPRPLREERIKAIADKLSNYDIICLQEVWKNDDCKLLSKTAELHGLRYSHIFSSGLLDSCGLMIISRFPFEDIHFHRFRVNGHAPRVDQGDYHVGKGIGFAKVRLNASECVNVFTSHLIAKYSTFDKYLPDRLAQAWELGSLIRMTTCRTNDELVLLMGDFNFVPKSLEYEILVEVGQLCDSYPMIHSDDGFTHLDHIDGKAINKRIDYIFFNQNRKFFLEDVAITMTHEEMIYSDHYAVSAVFSPSPSLPQRCPNLSFRPTGGVGGAYHFIQEGIEEAKRRRRNHFFRAFLFFLLLLLFHLMPVSIILIDTLWILVAVELFVGSFIATEDIHALSQIVSEMKFFITRSVNL